MVRLVLSIISILFGAGSAFAQSAAFNLTPPPGWTVKEVGSVMLLTPPNDPNGSTVLTIIPVLPTGGAFETMFNGQRAVLESAMKLRPLNMLAPAREPNAGGEIALESGVYTNGQKNFVVAFIGRGENGVLGMGMLISGDLANGPAYVQQVAGMLMAMRLSSRAQALALANVAALVKQAQQQQAQQAQAQQGAAPQAPNPPAKQNSGGYHWQPQVGYSGRTGMYIY
jgi:hypothetical protein